MRQRNSLRLIPFLIVGLLAGSVDAQRGANNRGGMNSRFAQNSPGIGEPLPDITAYDEQGREFKLRSIKDNYSVIVFGLY